MNSRRFVVHKDILPFSFLLAIWFLVSIVLGEEGNIGNASVLIYVFAVLGVCQFALTLNSSRHLQDQWITPYCIFFAFLFVFNYGQFAMWAVGIHMKGELTQTTFIRYIDLSTACRIEVITLEMFSAFHLGALLASGGNYPVSIDDRIDKLDKRVFRMIGTPILIVSATINIAYTIIWFIAARSMGYSALFDISMPSILKYLSYMFYPALFLNLVAHDFSRKSFFVLSTVFCLYAVPLLITGDRSSWIYFLGPWVFAFFKYVPKKRKNQALSQRDVRKRFIRSVILILCLIYLAAMFTSVRDDGISNYNFTDFDFADLTRPFIKPFFEMGQSAVLLGVMIQDKFFLNWEFGNTYISAILGMVFPRIRTFFGYPEFYIENWMSDYLSMGNYGVGFSAPAEAYLNGGLFFSWIYMLFYGFFIGKLVLLPNRGKNSAKRMFVSLSATAILTPSTRGSMDLFLRMFFWGVVVVLLIEQTSIYRYKNCCLRVDLQDSNKDARQSDDKQETGPSNTNSSP